MSKFIVTLAFLFAGAVYPQSNSKAIQSGMVVSISTGSPQQVSYFTNVRKVQITLPTARIRYAQSLEAMLRASGSVKWDGILTLSLRGLQKIELLPYSSGEQKIIDRVGVGCIKTTACNVRKASFTFSDKTVANVFVDFNSFDETPRYAVRDADHLYDLADYTTKAVTIR